MEGFHPYDPNGAALISIDTFEGFDETSPGVFHARSWGMTLNIEVLRCLANLAQKRPEGRSRLCLHPSPDSLEQQMVIAIAQGAQDPIHMHPTKRESLLRVSGEAEHVLYSPSGAEISRTRLGDDGCQYVSTPVGVFHSLVVISDVFVFWELAIGPFDKASTVRLGEN